MNGENRNMEHMPGSENEERVRKIENTRREH